MEGHFKRLYTVMVQEHYLEGFQRELQTSLNIHHYPLLFAIIKDSLECLCSKFC